MIKVGVNPIAWSNGDFPDLGTGVGFTQCLSEIRRAGYVGTELGNRFPTEPEVLARALEAHQLELVSGWYASRLLGRSAGEEARSFVDFVSFLSAVGGSYAVVAEATHCVQRDRDRPLRFDSGADVLSGSDWDRLAYGLDRLAEVAGDHGVQLVYHPHMGTVVQSQAQVHELMKRTTEAVRLTADTGHIRFAGDRPVAFLQEFMDRVGLVHLKDVRAPIVEQLTERPASFYEAVIAGVFTVPGDGDVDFDGVFDVLRRAGYDGWLVVEAEQDPEKADPFVYSKKGRETVGEMMRKWLGV